MLCDLKNSLSKISVVLLLAEDKVEYVKLKKGISIRLDIIQQFNDIDISSGKPCKIG